MTSASPEQWGLIAGPPFVGFMLNWGLLGVLFVQVYLYHVLFPADKAYFKVLVYGVFLLDCVQTFLLSSDFFENFIYRWGSGASFYTIGTGWFSFVMLGGIISAIVQLTFCWRLWLLTKSHVLVGVVLLLTTSQLSGSIAGGLHLRVSSTTTSQSEVNAPLAIWLLGSAVVDVIIAVSMTILLYRSKMNGQRFKANVNGQRNLSEPVVNRLIVFFIETGTLTASVAIVTLILFFVSPNTHLHECTAIILAKLYSNTLLAGFNNRALLKTVPPTSHLPSMLTPTTFTSVSFNDTATAEAGEACLDRSPQEGKAGTIILSQPW